MSDEVLQLDPKRSALIIQDLQNDVMIEGGAFADSGAPAHATAEANRSAPPRKREKTVNVRRPISIIAVARGVVSDLGQ